MSFRDDNSAHIAVNIAVFLVWAILLVFGGAMVGLGLRASGAF